MSPTPVSSIPQCTTTIKPDSNGWVPPGTCGYYGKMYYPSFTAAVIFSILAGIILLGHIIQAARHPKMGLQRLAVFASFCLFAGYVARTLGTRYQQNISITAFSDTMVLIIPICQTAWNHTDWWTLTENISSDNYFWLSDVRENGPNS